MNNINSLKLKKWALRQRRKIFEFFGNAHYSRSALNDLERKLERYLPHRDGFFIEAGANDGFSQSNTYYFEKIKNWSGILIEPIPHLYESCRKERVNSQVYNCALVSSGYKERVVSMFYSNLMSLVRGAKKTDEKDLEHARLGMSVQDDVDDVYEIDVPARTLTSILDEEQVGKIDFLSLDVEGFELNVLQGLDFTKYRPRFILIESWDELSIQLYLTEHGYRFVERFSYHDLLYEDVSGE